ncbi:hypothetical protein V9T40_010514 [Parthenolecanium corni]|uniref:furin n=1 Tax=Parthenolecanium corni TaxID=536013 RepID=A0AAN9T3P1_9HEMI
MQIWRLRSGVLWFEQQIVKKRYKRDFSSSFDAHPFDYSYYDANLLNQQLNLAGSHYRAGSQPNVFPDPLFKEQWYLNGGAKDGYDMNVAPAWKRGYTGKGVVVSILDDGIQTNHPDLALNYDPGASTDINDNDDNPMPRDNGDNKHGTRCAGEVAAVAFNNYCGVGIAYNASIGGVRMLDGTVNDAVEARALGLNINHIDIYSASWGPEDDGKTVDGPGPLARRAFIYGVTTGRQGKGSIFVWASGNGGRHTDCCNCDGYTNSIFTLSISSATQGGLKPWYLEECASSLATTYSSGTPGHDKSVGTVDMDGKLRPDHICTVEHTGTSASAPLAAGLVALALEANPNLTWRDMQYIVIMTAKSIPLEREPGWSVNGVKRKFSHKFGYGLMDGEAMVNLAEQWTSVPNQHICKSQEIHEDRSIDPIPGNTLTVYMDVNGCPGSLNEIRYLEHIQCKISLRFFPRGNLRIDLTSPMGTTSTLLFERPRDVVSSNFDNWPFLSVHFWGEKAEGRWTLRIHNNGNRHVNQPGILKSWQLIFYGTQSNPIRLKSTQPVQAVAPFAISQPQARSGSFPFGGSSGFMLGGGSNIGDVLNLSQPSFRSISELFASGTEPEGAMVVAPYQRPAQIIRSMEGKHILHDCDPECDHQGCYGRGATQCVSCKHYKLDNACVSRCPPRSFPNQGGLCWPCHDSCETCAGAGQDSCLTCAPAHLRVTDLAVCLQQCPEGYFENTEERTCVPCESNCASCQDRPDHCTSCHHNLVLSDNKCLAACPPNTYESDSCGSCYANCETCTGPAESNCTTCKSGFFELSNKCHASCPLGFYGDSKRRECVPCVPNCDVCHNNGTCVTCSAGYVLNHEAKCVTTGSQLCRTGEYSVNDSCARCHSTCETCSDGSPHACLSCPAKNLLQNNTCVVECSSGFFIDQSGCQPCLHTCEECLSRTNCSKCRTPLLLQSGECRTTCANGYYNEYGICAKCFLSCMTCVGPRRDECVTCPQGWQLAAGECHPECPQGFFMSDFGCQKCHHYCRTCKGEGPLQCTSCPPHFMLEDGGLCVECLGSQYYDPVTQLCKQCDSSCTACDGPGPSSCIACTYPLHLDKISKRCVPCCTERHSNDCCNCDNATGECVTMAPAGKRRTLDSEAQSVVSSGREYYNAYTSAPVLLILGCVSAILFFLVIFTFYQIKNKDPRGTYRKIPVKARKFDKVPIDLDDVENTSLVAHS